LIPVYINTATDEGGQNIRAGTFVYFIAGMH